MSPDPHPPAAVAPPLSELQARMRRLERRDYSAWITASVIMLLLLAAAWLAPLVEEGEAWTLPKLEFQMNLRGLLGLVLLFSIFSLYQQWRIQKLRRSLAQQIASTVESTTRAELFAQLSILDALTGLYNRRFLTEHLPIEMARAQRHGYPLSIVSLDMDGLKAINDRAGHAAGDQVLREFARRLKVAVRNSDLVVRLGGDEFVVVLPECAAAAVPRSLTRLRSVQVEVKGEMVGVGFSAGWVEYQPGEPMEKLLERADHALYEDKNTRRAESKIREAAQVMQQEQSLGILGKMTGGLVHHFNNLLTVIAGHSQLLRQRLQVDETALRHLQEIEKAAENAGALSSQLIAFARHRVLQPSSINLNHVVARTEGLISRSVGNSIALTTGLSEGLGFIRADEGQMQQVVLNLVLAARDAVPGMEHVAIETADCELDAAFCQSHPGARPGSYVRLSVVAGGSSSATYSRALDHAALREPLTAGHFGLSVIYGAVKQNLGYLWVDSGPGPQVMLSVYFPRIGAVQSSKAAALRAGHTA